MLYLQKYVYQKKQKTNVEAFNMIPKKMNLKQWQSIFPVIVHPDSIEQHEIQIRNRIIKHVNVNLEIVVHAKKTIVGTLTHVFVRIANIKKVLLILQ